MTSSYLEQQVSDGIEDSEMDDVDFIVIGPMENRTSHKTMCKTASS